MAGRSCQVRDDSDLDPSSNSGYGKKWLHSEYVLKVRLTNLLPGWMWSIREDESGKFSRFSCSVTFLK